mmetsp:Transcript_19733/g.50506  ORF Transcript_19733/g.50506 Transcript_19733/m.50506 type:complete len:608 (-) Transcript_19733:61-1884(-)
MLPLHTRGRKVGAVESAWRWWRKQKKRMERSGNKILFDPAFPLIILLVVAIIVFIAYIIPKGGDKAMERGEKASDFYLHQDTLPPRSEGNAKVERERESTPQPVRAESKPIAAEVEPSRREGEVATWKSRAEAVKDTLLRGWTPYQMFARGHDEIRPTTNRTNDSWGGFGVTLIDGLDTLWIMGLKKEFETAVLTLKENVPNFSKDYNASFFETTIRHLGGLLSAASLSGDDGLLALADDLGQRLQKAFVDGKRFPRGVINMETGKVRSHSWARDQSVLAEIGSFQLEFSTLACLTGDVKYDELAADAWRAAEALQDEDGLFPTLISVEDEKGATKERTMGGLSDSFFEYLIKGYNLKKGEEGSDRLLRMYRRSIDGLQKRLLKTTEDGLDYVGSIGKTGAFQPRFDHLSCFIPAMLFQSDEEKDIELGKRILRTCTELYLRSPTGLSPEAVELHNGPSKEISIAEAKYVLRPETVESLYWLYIKTGDNWAREVGWEIFESFQRFTAAPYGLSGLTDVTCGSKHLAASAEDGRELRKGLTNKYANEKDEGRKDCSSYLNDSMQSFTFAETLKYFYLLFSDDADFTSSEVLEKFVFNTEGHPLPKCTV